MANWTTIGSVEEEKKWEDLTPSTPPTVSEVNTAAGKYIVEQTPESIKDFAGKVAVAGEKLWEELPSPVQKGLSSTGNALMDIIEITSRPFKAQAATIGALFDEKSKQTVAQADNNVFAMFSDENLKRVQQEGIKGLKGEVTRSTQELLSDEFRRNHPVASFAFGLAGDIITDPLKAKVVGETMDLIKTGIKTIPGSTSVPGKLADNELFRAVNVNTGDFEKAQDLFNEFRFLRDKALLEGEKSVKDINKSIVKLASKIDLTDDAGKSLTTNQKIQVLKSKIVQDIELKNLSTEDIGLLEQKIVDTNRKALEEQRAVGIDIGDKGAGYMLHELTAEADAILNPKKKMFGLFPSGKTPAALERTMDDTINNINAKKLYDTEKFFIDDPAVLTGLTQFRAANAIAGKNYLNKVQELGIPRPEVIKGQKEVLPKGYRPLKDARGNDLPDTKGTLFPEDLAKQIESSHRILTNDQQINKFLKVWDGATNWWKMWSLGVRPDYYAKNTVGNIWNAYLGGLDNPVRYAEAANLQVKLAKNNFKGEIAGISIQKLYDEMTNRGVIGGGQLGGGDIARKMESLVQPSIFTSMGISNAYQGVKTGINIMRKDITKAPDVLQAGAKKVFDVTAGTENPLLQGGLKVSRAIEDNARIALFLDRIKKGDDFEKAAKHVQKYLFDYGDISQLERGVFKRIMPFYTWSRKNIPLQLEALATKPEKVNVINLANQNAQIAFNPDVPIPEDIPPYVKEQMPIFIGNKPTGEAVSIPLANLLPFADLNIITNMFNKGNPPESPIQKGKIASTASTLSSGVNPFLKSAAEWSLNYDLFRKKSIQDFPNQKVDFLGVQMSPHLAKLASNVVLLNYVNRLNPTIPGAEQLGLPTQPIFGERRLDKATGESITKPSIFGVQRESRTDLPEEERALQAIGLRFVDVDPNKFRMQTLAAQKKDAEEIRKLIITNSYARKNDQAMQVYKIMGEYLNEVRAYNEARAKSLKKKESMNIEINGVGRTE